MYQGKIHRICSDTDTKIYIKKIEYKKVKKKLFLEPLFVLEPSFKLLTKTIRNFSYVRRVILPQDELIFTALQVIRIFNSTNYSLIYDIPPVMRVISFS